MCGVGVCQGELALSGKMGNQYSLTLWGRCFPCVTSLNPCYYLGNLKIRMQGWIVNDAVRKLLSWDWNPWMLPSKVHYRSTYLLNCIHCKGSSWATAVLAVVFPGQSWSMPWSGFASPQQPLSLSRILSLGNKCNGSHDLVQGVKWQFSEDRDLYFVHLVPST